MSWAEKRLVCLALLFRRKFLQFERSLGSFKLGTRQFLLKVQCLIYHFKNKNKKLVCVIWRLAFYT